MIQNFFYEKRADVAEDNQQHCLEESGQRLENVDWTYLVLASGKLGLQKSTTVEKSENFKALRTCVLSAPMPVFGTTVLV